MSSLSTLPKGDSAWLLRKSIQRIMQQVSVLETNIGSSTTGNSSNTQIIFNDAGTLRGDSGLTYNKTTDLLSVGAATITGDLTVDTSTLKVDSANNRVGVNTASPATDLEVRANGNAEGTIRLYSSIDGSTASPKGSYFSFRSGTTGGGTETARLSSLNRLANVLGGDFSISTADTSNVLQNRLTIDSGGVFTFAVGGSTAMTLNSTGLGVGVASPAFKLDVNGVINTSSDIYALGGRFALYRSAGSSYIDWSSGQSLILRTVTSAGGAGASTIATIDATGNVGIGVTPSAWNTAFRGLDISTGGAIAGSSDSVRLFSNSAFNTAGNNVYKNAATAGRYDIQGNVHTWNISTNIPSAGGVITFSPAMTLDASGNLLVGTTTNGGNGVSIRPSTAAPNVVLVGSDTSGGTAWQLYSTGTSSNRFYVTWAGVVNAVNTTISGISDARLKENVQDIDVGLGAILALKPRKFDWKAGKGKDIKGDRGFIAQEFEQVFPQLVDEWADPAPEGEAPYKSVRQDLIPVLVKAIQELAAEVNALKNA